MPLLEAILLVGVLDYKGHTAMAQLDSPMNLEVEGEASLEKLACFN